MDFLIDKLNINAMKLIVFPIIIGTLMILLILFGIAVSLSHEFYCFVYEHEEWKLWNHFIKNSDAFTFDYELGGDYLFKPVNPSFHYYFVVWGGRTATLHKNDDSRSCILSEFQLKKSQKMAQLLMAQVNNAEG